MFMGFPGGSDGKESACSVGGLGAIPGLGRFPGEGNSCPLQYSCLENSMDRRVLDEKTDPFISTEWYSLSLEMLSVLNSIFY